MMRRQMGDIGAIANVCNTDLQEPADDSASAGRDEDFHAPTRRYHDISVFMTPPLCSHPQIPTHHRVPARRHGRNPELPAQLRTPTAKSPQQPQDATPTRGSCDACHAATPSYKHIAESPQPATRTTGIVITRTAPPANPAAQKPCAHATAGFRQDSHPNRKPAYHTIRRHSAATSQSSNHATAAAVRSVSDVIRSPPRTNCPILLRLPEWLSSVLPLSECPPLSAPSSSPSVSAAGI